MHAINHGYAKKENDIDGVGGDFTSNSLLPAKNMNTGSPSLVPRWLEAQALICGGKRTGRLV